MASVTQTGAGRPVEQAEHSNLMSLRSFDEETRRRLLAEDSLAWRSVMGVLFTIVTIGLLIGIVAVVLST